jgi:hypothetical protein
MNILYFHTNTILSSWTIWNGASIIRSLGHTVLDAAIPTDIQGRVITQITRRQFERFKNQLPKLGDLETCDCVVVVGPEYIEHWLVELYGKSWHQVPKRKIGVCLESTRAVNIKVPIAQVQEKYNTCWFPDPCDANLFNGYSTTPFVDLTRFEPNPNTSKRFGAGFVGSVYQSRVELLLKLSKLLREPLMVGDVHCHDIEGECHELWTSLYVNNIRQLRIHIALPSNNPMIVGRPFETLA